MKPNYKKHGDSIDKILTDLKGSKPYVEIDGKKIHMRPRICKPIEGYKPHDNFPNCCDYHKEASKGVKQWYRKFPDCCEPHRKMMKAKWFDKKIYAKLPKKIIDDLSYTEYHISKRIEKSNWYVDITNYIDYIVWSYGQPAIGVHHYYHFMKHFIGTVRWEIPEEKRRKLLAYVERKYDPPKQQKTDLNQLHTTYLKWLKTFPFEIDYFRKLKEKFSEKSSSLEMTPYTTPILVCLKWKL